MTMPHLMNCEHQPEGRCAKCSKTESDAEDWFSCKLSTAKLLSSHGVPYAQGSALLGDIWQALEQRHSTLRHELQNLVNRADADYAKSTDISDMTAEMARKRAFTEALSALQFHIGSAIKNTSQA